jgi:hypothetical protein
MLCPGCLTCLLGCADHAGVRANVCGSERQQWQLEPIFQYGEVNRVLVQPAVSCTPMQCPIPVQTSIAECCATRPGQSCRCMVVNSLPASSSVTTNACLFVSAAVHHCCFCLCFCCASKLSLTAASVSVSAVRASRLWQPDPCGLWPADACRL